MALCFSTIAGAGLGAGHGLFCCCCLIVATVTPFPSSSNSDDGTSFFAILDANSFVEIARATAPFRHSPSSCSTWVWDVVGRAK